MIASIKNAICGALRGHPLSPEKPGWGRRFISTSVLNGISFLSMEVM
jgi:hypothetical protein